MAQQHYETFRERFAGYPINIQTLSRFRSRKEQNETIKGLRQGTVDIVIGTHRILSQDLVFKDLGLLIVDEEQRFGVTHKEKLKKLKTNVDVLTLTATPIPRTLHMSMLGVRDCRSSKRRRKTGSRCKPTWSNTVRRWCAKRSNAKWPGAGKSTTCTIEYREFTRWRRRSRRSSRMPA
ncbi:hypothetical protein HMSSN036_64360 [Paenibacillus macerans]|nr:hypothetical protein HMSSN036_64360 [Paenibacillus macerans]